MRINVKGHGYVEAVRVRKGRPIGDRPVYDGSLHNPPNGVYELGPAGSTGIVIGSECKTRWAQLREPLPTRDAEE